jgi:hypothetical protein
LIVEQADFDVVKLASLVGNYHHLPSPASTTLRGKLLSDHCLDLSEQDRMPLWDALCKLIARHRKFPKAGWSLGNDSLLPMEEIANQLAPKSPTLLNRRLFSDSRKQEKLFQRQKSAIEDILSEGGVSQVLKFASTVSNADSPSFSPSNRAARSQEFFSNGKMHNSKAICFGSQSVLLI